MNTLLRFRHLLGFLFVLHACCGLGVEMPTGASARIGEAGDPARLWIEGVKTFTEAELRRALRSDLDYLVAAHPEATPSECLAALEERVRAGYQNSGFRDVAVQARLDVPTGRIVAKIVEGPRFRYGPLRVTGLKSIPVADFTRRLTEKLAPRSAQGTSDPGMWPTGAWVNFRPDSLADGSAAVSNTFAALGRFAAKFKVEIQTNPDDTNAALAVIVQDEGPAAVLGDIVVVGNKKNRRDEVISFLGLSNGMAVTQDLIDERAPRLTQTGRFTDSSITPTAFGPDGQVALSIAVGETDRLPPLSQPLSREERALLHMREWLMAWESRQDDLVISWLPPTARGKDPLRIEFIVAPSGGIVARVMAHSPGQEASRDLYSMVITTNALGLFAQVHERKLRVPLPTVYGGVIFVSLGASSDSPSGFTLSTGAGLSPGLTNANWRVRLDLIPAAFADLLYRPGTEVSWQGNVLIIRTKELVMRVDEASGHLLELGFIAAASPSGQGAPERYGGGLRFTSGAFAKAVDQIESSSSAYPDVFQSQRALGSALGFLAAELAQAEPLWHTTAGDPSAAPSAALAAALEKLLASSFLDPLQTLLNEAKTPRGDPEFTIPAGPSTTQDPMRQVFEKVGLWCAGHAQELTPAGSWLQALLRELAFTSYSRTEHRAATLARLGTDANLGPIGCFAVLHVFAGSSPGSSASFATLGSKRLSTEDFSRDYRMLLSSGSVVPHCLANLGRELSILTKPEVEALVGLLPPDAAALLREIAWASGEAKDLPVEDAIGPALDRWWKSSARSRVAADFQSHVFPRR
jgi:hypothetical protein